MEDYLFLFTLIPVMLCLFVLAMCCQFRKTDVQSAGMEGNAHAMPTQTTNHTQPSAPPTNQSPPGNLFSTKPYIVEDDLPPSYFEAVSSSKPSLVINANT